MIFVVSGRTPREDLILTFASPDAAHRKASELVEKAVTDVRIMDGTGVQYPPDAFRRNFLGGTRT